jgi:Rv0078B-related antitoxin
MNHSVAQLHDCPRQYTPRNRGPPEEPVLAVAKTLRYNPSMVPAIQSTQWPLAVALDLCETGVVLMRQNLRRKFPDANDQEIDGRLQDWLRHRPGAELGDAPGRALDAATRFP